METTKNSDVRVNNRKRLVNTLFRKGAITKHDLALKLDISLPTVTLLLKELTAKGLITKGEMLGSTGGRKPVCIAPVYDAKYAVGAEISQHEFRVVLVDLGANVIASEDYPLGLQDSREYWNEINRVLADFISRNVSDREKLLDIGIALQLPMENGGILYKDSDEEMCSPDLAVAAECFEMPVKFYNSAKVAAIAQVWAAHGGENFLFLSLGSYIGGAMIYHGVIVDFPGRGGTFGDIVVAAGDRQQKAEAFCSAGALCSRAKVPDIDAFFERVGEQDERCCELWDEYVAVLGVFLHNLYSIFGWEIVIGGSLSPWIEKYQTAVGSRLEELVGYRKEPASCFRISDLGKFGAAIGAAQLPIDRFLEFGYDEM